MHLDDAVVANVPTLADVNAVFGNITSLDIIADHLHSVLSFAGVDITKEQGQETALAILANYYYLNLAELCIFFSKLKAGEFGQLVWGSRLNNQAIMVALKGFISERYNSIIRAENNKYKEEAERGYSTINEKGAAIVNGIEGYKQLEQKAKTDFKAFLELFPKMPSGYASNVVWLAYSGDEGAIESIFKKPLSKEDAFKRIAKGLCDINSD